MTAIRNNVVVNGWIAAFNNSFVNFANLAIPDELHSCIKTATLLRIIAARAVAMDEYDNGNPRNNDQNNNLLHYIPLEDCCFKFTPAWIALNNRAFYAKDLTIINNEFLYGNNVIDPVNFANRAPIGTDYINNIGVGNHNITDANGNVNVFPNETIDAGGPQAVINLGVFLNDYNSIQANIADYTPVGGLVAAGAGPANFLQEVKGMHNLYQLLPSKAGGMS